MSFSRWPRTHAVRVTGHEAKQWPGVAKAAFPGVSSTRSSPSTVDHNPSSLRFLAVTLTACVATLKKTYIARELSFGHSAGYMSTLYPSSVFSPG